jgi:GNAT superfamily N-acetyltransferase
MVNITYISGNKTLLNKIEPLWQQLNQLHLSRSPYFKDYYQTMTFDDRKRMEFQRAWGGAFRVDIAMDDSVPVGYCLCSIDRWQMGEIDSIFVDEKYRHQGIGSTLMKNALAWLTEKGAKKKIVTVAFGNEEAWKFYAQFGFLPRRTLLEEKKR